jgi:hypothetical protein
MHNGETPNYHVAKTKSYSLYAANPQVFMYKYIEILAVLVCFSACLFLVQIYLFAINLLDYFLVQIDMLAIIFMLSML